MTDLCPPPLLACPRTPDQCQDRRRVDADEFWGQGGRRGDPEHEKHGPVEAPRAVGLRPSSRGAPGRLWLRIVTVLDGTVALVTGASSGIGEATALALAGHGAAVALAARRKDRLEEVAAVIRDGGGIALVVASDVTDEQQATAAVERTVSELGRLDTLVNNAGVMLLGPAVGAPLEEWQRMVELNLLALLYCTHAALPHLLDAADREPRRVADVVNISSVAGRFARSGNGVYALTKFGVGAFSESLRQEVTKRYVRVSLVEPGATATELAGHNRAEILESIRSQFGQTMAAGDIADAVGYIVTRSRQVTINEMLIRPTEQER